MKIYNKIKLVVLLFIINIFSFAQDYHRITSLNLSSDEMLVALVEPSKIVALSSKISEDEDMSNITNIAKNFPKLEKNLESILNSNPDLVIGADWIDSSLIQSIKDAGIDVYIYKTPKSLKEQEQVILELGKVLNEEEKSKKLVIDMEEKIKRTQEKIAKLNIKNKPRVMLYTAYETTSDEKTSFNDLVNAIGGINPVVGSGADSFQKISKEKVIEIDPDVIIVPLWTSKIDSNKFFKKITKDKSLAEVKAIKNKRVYGVPYKKLSPSSQYMADGVEALAKVVYQLEE